MTGVKRALPAKSFSSNTSHAFLALSAANQIQSIKASTYSSLHKSDPSKIQDGLITDVGKHVSKATVPNLTPSNAQEVTGFTSGEFPENTQPRVLQAQKEQDAFLRINSQYRYFYSGYIANSLAIMTDALHMLTDLSAIILTLLALWLSSKSPTKRFTFGFHRLEVLSAMISVLLVYILMGFLLYEAVQRTIHMKYEINGDIMLITAAIGVAVNVIMGFLLNQSGHHHAHSHSLPSNSPTTGPRCGHNQGQDSLAVRAAFVHALGDLVQSVGVLIAAYIIRFKPEYRIADPICTYVFSLLVAFTTFRIIWDTVVIILEGVPSHLNVDYIKEALMKIEDVHSVEDLNIWSLTSGKPTAIVHIQLIPGSSSKWEEVQSKAKHLLLNTFGMYKCTIQLQSYRQEVNRTCANCQSSSS
ncbi:hypothetical protein E5288_WYG006604 [Bos mutus]|uniref:Probable proton-coupled zinc antiporter SLC30A4 n=1 Tax=Bos mutus TaxID=72004 RepID=A0A6B0RA37_9CETA|nr:hypothetical protein [Bos mutus]